MKTPQDEARRWLEQARNDLEAARALTASGFHAQACFMAQQAAEKAAKALHFAGGARLVIGHSVAQILAGLPPAEGVSPDLVKAGHLLDQYYIPTRYPNGLPGGTPADAYGPDQSKAALAAAQSVLDFVARHPTPPGS